MPLNQSFDIILLYRLRARARRAMEASRKAGNPAVTDIYQSIDRWLEAQMKFAISGQAHR